MNDETHCTGVHVDRGQYGNMAPGCTPNINVTQNVEASQAQDGYQTHMQAANPDNHISYAQGPQTDQRTVREEIQIVSDVIPNNDSHTCRQHTHANAAIHNGNTNSNTTTHNNTNSVCMQTQTQQHMQARNAGHEICSMQHDKGAKGQHQHTPNTYTTIHHNLRSCDADCHTSQDARISNCNCSHCPNEISAVSMNGTGIPPAQAEQARPRGTKRHWQE